MSDENRARLLYYFTPVVEFARIADEAQISVDSTAIVAGWGRRRIRVVWLTDDPHAEGGVDGGFGPARSSDFRAEQPSARITVAVSDAQRWSMWAQRHRVSRKTRRRLDDAVGGTSGRWWVVARSIPAAEWLRADDVRTGDALWTQPAPSADQGVR